VKSGDVTYGHRFLSQGPIEVRRFEDYEKKLHDAYVLIDPARRKEIIWEDAKAQAFVHGLEPIADEGLLEEVSGLAEWPVVLTGKIEDQFMDVPAEILQTSMRTHQKYFSTRDPKTGKLANRFIVVANMVAKDGGKEIVAGNERVLRARLSDAKFFWDQDRQTKLADRVEDLKGIVFHAKLGTQYERMSETQSLAAHIASTVKADVNSVTRAIMLAKADLTTGVVGEFPELQGIMGRYYALHDKEADKVADAIRNHYKPQGPGDAVPSGIVSIVAGLADKLHTLVGMFAIGERPTGSGDPYALRRAALGIIRIVLENRIRLGLGEVIDRHTALVRNRISDTLPKKEIIESLLLFVADRLKVALREKGIRHDLIDAIFSLGNEDDLVRLVARVEALQTFLKSDDGTNLLTAYKRAANILKVEERKDETDYSGSPDPEAFVLPEEKALFVELATASELIRAEVQRERFVEAMGVMARLRKPVDAFFDKVTVNDKDPALRKNRLLLLSRLRSTLHLVADFSKIEG
jgi:glycyl-tRNA synthetase beta chain